MASASPDFLNVAFDRCTAVPGAKAVLICNPGGPLAPAQNRMDRHWAGGSYSLPVDRQSDATCRCLEAHGRTLWRRDADVPPPGIRAVGVSSEGAIYPQMFEVTGEPSDTAHAFRYGLAVDYGHTNPTHALLMAQYDNGEVWALREWRWVGATQGDREPEWVADQIHSKLVQGRKLDLVVVDDTPSENALRIRRALKGQSASKEPGSVNAGIEKVGQLMFDR